MGYAQSYIQENDVLKESYERITDWNEELYIHSVSVAEYAVAIGLKYNLNLDSIVNIAIGSLLHDLGKTSINPNVLSKPAKLSIDERIFVESHPNLGYRLIEECNIPKLIKDIVKYHHEKLDNTGYPDRLPVSKLPIEVQIVTVADIYSALTSKRAYKEAEEPEVAIDIMKQDKGINQIAVQVLEEMVL